MWCDKRGEEIRKCHFKGKEKESKLSSNKKENLALFLLLD